MLAPKKLKRRKPHRPDVLRKGPATSNTRVSFGSFALKATESGWIKAKQLEAARRVVTKYIKKGGKLWIRVFPHAVIGTKGSQTTMGGGKGVPDYYVAVVRAGNILFEIEGLSEVQAREAFKLAAYKFPVKCQFVKR